MNILLPKEYRSVDVEGRLEAEIIDDILYIYRPLSFKKLMYDITYILYGDTCVYCKNEKANSIDHRYPQDFGGPTITNNLYPTCKTCNNLKGNLTEDEFYELLKFESRKERNEFKKTLKDIQSDRRFGTVKALPDEWISEDKYKILTVRFYISEPLGAKYKHLLNFFNEYKRHKNPIIISSNGVLLDGFNTLMISKFKNRLDFDQIILDNVVVKLPNYYRENND